MSSVKGLVEGVSIKPTKKPGFFKVGLKVDGQWYNAFTKRGNEDDYRGRLVQFDFTVDDYGNKIDTASLKVAKAPVEAAPVKASGGGRIASIESGIAVGHAINNAVQLAIANGNTSFENIRLLAENVLELSVHLNRDYLLIVEAAKHSEPEEQPEPEAPAPTPPPAKPAPKAAPKKAAPKAAAKPAPTPPGDETEWEDDIPF